MLEFVMGLVEEIDGRKELSDRTAELLRWLGVPAFADGVANWKYGRILPLIWMIAFQLGVLSAFDQVSDVVLIVAAPVVALLAFLTLPISAGVIRAGYVWSRWWLIPLALVPVLVFSLVRNTVFPVKESDPPWLLPHHLCNAVITLTVLYAAMIVLLPQSQASSGGRLTVHRLLLLFVAVANVASVTVFPLPLALGPIGRGVVGQDISLLPLILVVIALGVALWLPDGFSPEAHRNPSYAIAVPAAILILILGFVNAGLVRTVDRTVLLMVDLLICGALVLPALVGLPSWVVRRLPEGAGLPNVHQHVSEPKQRVWIPVFLIAYPLVVVLTVDQEVRALGYDFEGVWVAVAMLVFNGVYVGFVWVLVRFGVDQIIAWSIVEFWRRTAGTLRHIAASVPLLLIAVAFFALTAETWQIAHRLKLGELLALCVGGLLLAAVLGIGWTVPRVGRLAEFDTWEAVADNIRLPGRRGRSGDRNNWDEVVEDLKCAISRKPRPDVLKEKLGPLAWINAMLVVIAYQLFVFPVIVALLFVLFSVLCKMAVTPEVAAEWIFGDGEFRRASELKRGFDPDSPWLRVPLFLTVFSILYFATHSLASTASRRKYFKGGDAAIQLRFAIRLGFLLARAEEERQPAVGAVEDPGVAQRCSPAVVAVSGAKAAGLRVSHLRR